MEELLRMRREAAEYIDENDERTQYMFGNTVAEHITTNDNVATLVREKYAVAESACTQWFSNNPISLTEEELADDRAEHIVRKRSDR